jgi:Predicted heme/steroid binding protein
LKSEVDKMKQFTLEELKQYNGENGQPAYVAIDGIVYDVSMSILGWWETPR